VVSSPCISPDSPAVAVRLEIGKAVVEVVRHDHATQQAYPIELCRMVGCQLHIERTKLLVQLGHRARAEYHARHSLVPHHPSQCELCGRATLLGQRCEQFSYGKCAVDKVAVDPGALLPGLAEARSLRPRASGYECGLSHSIRN